LNNLYQKPGFDVSHVAVLSLDKVVLAWALTTGIVASNSNEFLAFLLSVSCLELPQGAEGSSAKCVYTVEALPMLRTVKPGMLHLKTTS
jgi:hypothetical protein